MIARRGVLGLLLGAPAIANSAAGALNEVPSGAMGVSCGGISAEDPLTAAAHRFLEKRRDKLHRRLDPPKRMPARIASKKSWSPTFKEHCLEADYAAAFGSERLWEMSPEEIMAEAIKRGFTG